MSPSSPFSLACKSFWIAVASLCCSVAPIFDGGWGQSNFGPLLCLARVELQLPPPSRCPGNFSKFVLERGEENGRGRNRSSCWFIFPLVFSHLAVPPTDGPHPTQPKTFRPQSHSPLSPFVPCLYAWLAVAIATDVVVAARCVLGKGSQAKHALATTTTTTTRT